MAAALLVIGLVSSMFVYVPYYGIAPGDAQPAAPLVRSDDIELYPSEGQLLYTTVSLRRLTAFGAVVGWLDRDVDVEPQREVIGDQTPKENRQESLRVMGVSKEAAEYVALTHLGYDVGLSGGGVVVVAVDPSVPAASVLSRGDVITAVDGQPVSLVGQLAPILGAKQPGDHVDLTVHQQAGGPERVEEVTLVARTTGEGGPIIGIQPDQDPSVVFDFPLDLEINSGSVGGPSAGLAFTLTVLDALTPGDLTGGRKVAVTGTIELDGSVGPIGGIRQKVVAVEHADADLFLVPMDELDLAKAEAGDDLTVVGVANLDDALQALAQVGGNAMALGTPGSGS